MATDINGLEQTALASIMGTKLPLPNLRQNFFAGILSGSISVGGVAAGKVLISPTVGLYTGTGSPEGFVAAGMSSLYLRSDGAGGSFVYVKVSGTGNTGWQAIA